MSDITVHVQEVDVFSTAEVREQGMITASTNLYNPIASIHRLTDIGDVDSTSLVNGSLLVYNSLTSRWITTTTLNNQNVDAGEF
jgi:hypothetical protein